MKRSAALLAFLVLTAGAGQAHEQAQTPAISGPADEWVYPLAAPGTYSLPAIGRAADASLLDENGEEVSLAASMAGRITLLAFIYTRCGDICPMASAYMAQVQQLASQGGLSDDFGMISLSFDPQYDTPERMREYAGNFRSGGNGFAPWLFLTARDDASIKPVLDAYNQPVARKRDAASRTGPLSHLLRVFLVDASGTIRNIYSADFLDPRLIVNDVQTLLAQAR